MELNVGASHKNVAHDNDNSEEKDEDVNHLKDDCDEKVDSAKPLHNDEKKTLLLFYCITLFFEHCTHMEISNDLLFQSTTVYTSNYIG